MSVADSIASCGLQALVPSGRKMLFVVEGGRCVGVGAHQPNVSEHRPKFQGNFRHSVEDFHKSLM